MNSPLIFLIVAVVISFIAGFMVCLSQVCQHYLEDYACIYCGEVFVNHRVSR